MQFYFWSMNKPKKYWMEISVIRLAHGISGYWLETWFLTDIGSEQDIDIT